MKIFNGPGTGYYLAVIFGDKWLRLVPIAALGY